MKHVRLYFLKYRLASIFKLAEQFSDSGVEPGDERYVNLLAEALKLIHLHERKYPDFDVNVEVPRLDDLTKLTVPIPAPDMKKFIAPALAAVGAVIVFIGALTAAIDVSYHGWLHLFHWILGG